MKQPDSQISETPAGSDRSRYVTPRLETLGDIRDLTLGGSPGTGDSPGDPANQKSIGAGPQPSNNPQGPPRPDMPPQPGQ